MLAQLRWLQEKFSMPFPPIFHRNNATNGAVEPDKSLDGSYNPAAW